MSGAPSGAGRLLVAQLGARRGYAVPRGLHACGRLERLVTDATGDLWPWRLLRAVPPRRRPAALRRLLARRVEGVPRDRVRGLPGFALAGLFDRPRAGGEPQPARWARRNARFARGAAARGFGGAGAVYAFNGAALEVLDAARARGLVTVLDQTSMPWRDHTRVLLGERARHPGWETAPGELDEEGALAAREEAEWERADLVVCGSAGVRDALAARGVGPDRVAVVPYGVDAARFRADRGGTGAEPGPLRVLFAGKVQLAKGVAYLLDAARRLDPGRVRLRLVGPVALGAGALAALREAGVEVAGGVPRPAMPGVYARAQVFVFPSLSEGSANACYEAMASGLPLVVTREAGSVARDGEDGWIVPARDGRAIAEALERLAGDPARRRAMGASAAARAAAFPTSSYGARLAAAIDGRPAGGPPAGGPDA